MRGRAGGDGAVQQSGHLIRPLPHVRPHTRPRPLDLSPSVQCGARLPDEINWVDCSIRPAVRAPPLYCCTVRDIGLAADGGIGHHDIGQSNSAIGLSNTAGSPTSLPPLYCPVCVLARFACAPQLLSQSSTCLSEHRSARFYTLRKDFHWLYSFMECLIFFPLKAIFLI